MGHYSNPSKVLLSALEAAEDGRMGGKRTIGREAKRFLAPAWQWRRSASSGQRDGGSRRTDAGGRGSAWRRRATRIGCIERLRVCLPVGWCSRLRWVRASCNWLLPAGARPLTHLDPSPKARVRHFSMRLSTDLVKPKQTRLPHTRGCLDRFQTFARLPSADALPTTRREHSLSQSVDLLLFVPCERQVAAGGDARLPTEQSGKVGGLLLCKHPL